MSVENLLRTTGTLRRPTIEKDESGGMTRPFVDVSGKVDVPCDIQRGSGSSRQQYMQVQANAVHTIYTVDDLEMRPGDLFVSASGRKFQFLGRQPDHEGYPDHLKMARTDVEEQFG